MMALGKEKIELSGQKHFELSIPNVGLFKILAEEFDVLAPLL
jgi:hypothetical protein